ncbi:MAG: DUF3426 domain-containing protein [Bryobacteraceae bacterium]|nr:DUF3426 domain-containing protein [Bryobacteraceae bacterium]
MAHPLPGSRPADERGSALFAVALVVAIIVVAGGAIYLFLARRAAAPPPAASAQEARAYVKHLALSEVNMKATESYLQSQLVEITGKITNKGERMVALIEINCIFYDPYGQVILREKVPIVRPRGGPLKPGETRAFRLPFDNLAQSWNQSLPQMVIAQIQFAQ